MKLHHLFGMYFLVIFWLFGNIFSLHGVVSAQETPQRPVQPPARRTTQPPTRQPLPPIKLTEENFQRMDERAKRREQRLPVPEETKEYLNSLLQKGFAHREQIKSGQMTLTNHLATWQGDTKRSSDRTVTIAFDENRRRVDRHNMYSTGRSYDDVGCIGCYKKDNRLIIRYSNDLFGMGGDIAQRTIMSVYAQDQLKEDIATRSWTRDFGFMPQYFACFFVDRFPTFVTLEKAKNLFLGGTIGFFEAGVADLTLADEEYKGTICKKITLNAEFDNGSTLYVLWIAEGQGHSIRKQYRQSTSGGPLFPTWGKEMTAIEELEVDVALDKESGIWFPTAWHYERNDDGKPRTLQKVTVKDVVLNKPLPEKLFDMKDIKILPPGAMVFWYAKTIPPPHGATLHGQLIWDGNDIVTRGMYAEGLVKNFSTEHKSKRLKTFFLVNTAVIALISAIYFGRMYQRLKQQS